MTRWHVGRTLSHTCCVHCACLEASNQGWLHALADQRENGDFACRVHVKAKLEDA